DGKLYEWTKTFPTEFFKEIFRLKQWEWNAGKMSPLVGRYINDLVYSRLANGVLNELKRINPSDEKGRRKTHHHRFLTRDIGHPELTRRIYELLGMAKAFKMGEWDRYKALVHNTFQKNGQNLELDFGE
ncbi:MAG TPA: P63C domain-containing protein, partial [Terrimicrobiaceae bacterium]